MGAAIKYLIEIWRFHISEDDAVHLDFGTL
jgi:hypothetical protein